MTFISVFHQLSRHNYTTTRLAVRPALYYYYCAFSSSPGSLKLRRPAGYRDKKDTEEGAEFIWRRNAVTIFPGDFSDGGVDAEDAAWLKKEDPESYKKFMDEETAFLDEDDVARRRRERINKTVGREMERLEAEKRARWIENAKPKVWKSKIDERGRAFGKGGRKRAIANVFLQPGLGEIVVNKKDFVDYFWRRSDRAKLLFPMVVTETMGKFDVHASTRGGGLTGQANAIRLAIARALNAYNPDLYRPVLKRQGLLTRDARIVESKKIGLVKARKAPQWVRR